MTSIINASTTGAGGVSVTADASGVLALQAGGVTAATFTGAATALVGPLTVAGSFSAYASLFGSGADGTVAITSGTTTLTRDMYYANLTISGTGAIATNSFRIFVSNILDISAAPAGAIQSTKNVGNNASGATAGAFTAAIGQGSLPPPQISGGFGAGSNGGTSAGAAGNTPTAQNSLIGGQGATAGNGGTAGGNAGGAGGVGQLSTYNSTQVGLAHLPWGFPGFFASRNTGYSTNLPGGVGGGGGAGGGDSTNAGGGGGGAGNPGSHVFISARYINRGGSTAAGALSASAADSGNGGNGVAGNAAGGGGAAGSGGGVLYICYEYLTGSTATNALVASGGRGGNGGNGLGTGGGGLGGTGGQGGTIVLYQITGATFSVSAWSPAGTAPSAPSGVTGGTGGAGAVVQGSL